MSEELTVGDVRPDLAVKYICRECGHIASEFLLAQSPFDEIETIMGCPDCKQINTARICCWKCDKQASGGHIKSTEYRYVWSCYEHRPE